MSPALAELGANSVSDSCSLVWLCNASVLFRLPRLKAENCFCPAGRAEVAVSSHGNFCSVLWPEQSEYAVYATDSAESTASWRELARGSAVSVAWAATSSTLAVLHVPKVGETQSASFACPSQHKELATADMMSASTAEWLTTYASHIAIAAHAQSEWLQLRAPT